MAKVWSHTYKCCWRVTCRSLAEMNGSAREEMKCDLGISTLLSRAWPLDQEVVHSGLQWCAYWAFGAQYPPALLVTNLRWRTWRAKCTQFCRYVWISLPINFLSCPKLEIEILGWTLDAVTAKTSHLF